MFTGEIMALGEWSWTYYNVVVYTSDVYSDGHKLLIIYVMQIPNQTLFGI